MNHLVATLVGNSQIEGRLPMAIVSRITIVVPLRDTRVREHDRRLETLRFLDTYANVKWSDIANTNQRVGADSVTRVTTPDSQTIRAFRKGASA